MSIEKMMERLIERLTALGVRVIRFQSEDCLGLNIEEGGTRYFAPEVECAGSTYAQIVESVESVVKSLHEHALEVVVGLHDIRKLPECGGAELFILKLAAIGYTKPSNHESSGVHAELETARHV